MSPADQPISDITEAVHRTLDELGVRDAAALDTLFSKLKDEFWREVARMPRVGDTDLSEIESLRVRWVGRNQGILRAINDNWLRQAQPELKREVGLRLNKLRAQLEEPINELIQHRGLTEVRASVGASYESVQRVSVSTIVPIESGIDVTLPGNRRPIGVRHILRQAIDEITKIFASLGFSVEEGPEIESVYYNFEALNIPEDHPSRDDQDTFYIDRQTVLRTHTSPVQIRAMEKRQPPIRIIVPGKVYRNETPDASHSWMFHQVEGLAVDTNITFADLKGTLDHFMKAFFGPQVRTRFRPSFFPFTEPSAEMDVSCIFCGGVGCRICKGSGWLELGGCGMVDPAVFAYVNYDASQYSGFAFGFGVERPAMLKYGIQDIQQFFQGDIRFLRQFR